VLRSYLDDSGKADDPAHVAITLAGYVFDADAWEHFDAQWWAALDRHGAKYFHCKDAFHLVKPFDAWTHPQVDALYHDLREALKESAPNGVVSIVNLADYRALLPQGNKADDPYCLCFADCMAYIEALAGAREDYVTVTLDSQDDFGNAALGIWKEMTDYDDDQSGRKVQKIAFAKMRQIPGLQGADVLAWEANKQVTEVLRATDRPTRKSLLDLLGNLAHNVKYWDRRALENVKRQ